MTLTYHCQYERANRMKKIIQMIGLGQVVAERYAMTSKDVQAKGYTGKYICITDTGITIIKSEDKQKIITVYVTTARELNYVYRGAKNVPCYLQRKVDHNQSKYIRNGKTIWAT